MTYEESMKAPAASPGMFRCWEISYCPNCRTVEGIAIGVLFLADHLPEFVAMEKLQQWQNVLNYDRRADTDFLDAALDNVYDRICHDRQYLMRMLEWESAIRISLRPSLLWAKHPETELPAFAQSVLGTITNQELLEGSSFWIWNARRDT